MSELGNSKIFINKIIFLERCGVVMKIVDNQQEEYKAFLKNIRAEREDSPKFA